MNHSNILCLQEFIKKHAKEFENKLFDYSLINSFFIDFSNKDIKKLLINFLIQKFFQEVSNKQIKIIHINSTWNSTVYFNAGYNLIVFHDIIQKFIKKILKIFPVLIDNSLSVDFEILKIKYLNFDKSKYSLKKIKKFLEKENLFKLSSIVESDSFKLVFFSLR